MTMLNGSHRQVVAVTSEAIQKAKHAGILSSSEKLLTELPLKCSAANEKR
jgi:hypothetical protein